LLTAQRIADQARSLLRRNYFTTGELADIRTKANEFRGKQTSSIEDSQEVLLTDSAVANEPSPSIDSIASATNVEQNNSTLELEPLSPYQTKL